MAMTKETYEEVKNAESMVASFSYNSYDKHGGRTTQEEEKNWPLKDLFRSGLKKMCMGMLMMKLCVMVVQLMVVLKWNKLLSMLSS